MWYMTKQNILDDSDRWTCCKIPLPIWDATVSESIAGTRPAPDDSNELEVYY
jgi:hypothetical protein